MPKHSRTIPPTVTRRELDIETLPRRNGCAPLSAYALDSQPGSLTVSVLNYGERQPGAEDIDLRFSRPLASCDCLSTTNGKPLFSPSGTRLLLHDLFLVIAIDTATLSVWHFGLPARTLLLDVGWVEERIVGRTLGYGQPASEAAAFGPWSWTQIEQTWATGLGDRLTMTSCA